MRVFDPSVLSFRPVSCFPLFIAFTSKDYVINTKVAYKHRNGESARTIACFKKERGFMPLTLV